MRVLFLNHTAWVGGAEHSLLELFRFLPEQGVSCAAAVPPGALAERLAGAEGGVWTLPLHHPRRPHALRGFVPGVSGLVQDAWRLRRLMKRLRPDLVHANSAKAALPGALAARSLGIPCLWHCRDLAPPLAPLLFRLCSGVVTISETVSRSLPPSPRKTLIVNGIDLDRFDPGRVSREKARAALGVSRDVPLVLLVADLVSWKRHDLFLAAAALIRRKHPGAQFIIAGADRGEHPDLAGKLRVQTASLGLSGAVRWMGHCPDSAPLFAASDVLLHPAGNEPFGRVVCEALAMGCRVVVPDRGGAAEIAAGCPGAARRVGQEQGSAFAQAVLDLLALPPPDPSARAYIAERYNVRRTAAELAGYFRRVFDWTILPR